MTKNGTAIAGKDYVAKTGTATFQPGTLTKTILIDIIGSNVKGPNTQFYLMLSKPVNVKLTPRDSGICKLKNDAGLSELDVSKQLPESVNVIKVYPNPAGNAVNVLINAAQNETVQLEVLDMQGRRMMEKSTSLVAGTSTQNINVSSLNSGTYFVKVETSEGESTVRFVKAN